MRLSLSRSLLIASAALFAIPADAQPINDSNISSYPMSNQMDSAPNEPDSNSGSAASTYRLPAENSAAPVNGTGASPQGKVIFDSHESRVPGNNGYTGDSTWGNSGIIYIPNGGAGAGAAAYRR